MHVFLTGGTGYIGAVVLERLVRRGDEVSALARSDSAATALAAAGARPVRGDLRDTGVLDTAARAADAVLHLGAPGDATSGEVDAAVAGALLAALAGSGKPYLHSGGIWVYGSNDAITPDAPLHPPALTAWRVPVQEQVLAGAASGVRSVLVAPSIVYGRGGGLPTTIVQGPRTPGDRPALLAVGDGSQHWTTVHVEDLAELYVLALDAPAGSVVLGASGDCPTVRSLTEAASRAAGLAGRVEPEGAQASRERLGREFADALMLDQQVSHEVVRVLGWAPSRPTLLHELEFGSYAP